MKSVTNTPEASSSEPSSGQQSNGGKTPEHDFCLLDQSNRRNIFLAEILRGITKTSLNNRTGPKIVKKILALAVKEIDMLIEACASKLALLKSEKSDSLQMVSSELQDLKKIKGHVELIKKTLMKHHRQGKNVARVILGVDPIPPKHSSDGMFPVVPKYGSLPTVPVKKQSKQAKEAEIIKSKKTKKTAKKKKGKDKMMSHESAMGDVAINRALSLGVEMDKSKGVQTAGAHSSALHLNAIEVSVFATSSWVLMPSTAL